MRRAARLRSLLSPISWLSCSLFYFARRKVCFFRSNREPLPRLRDRHQHIRTVRTVLFQRVEIIISLSKSFFLLFFYFHLRNLLKRYFWWVSCLLPKWFSKKGRIRTYILKEAMSEKQKNSYFYIDVVFLCIAPYGNWRNKINKLHFLISREKYCQRRKLRMQAS